MRIVNMQNRAPSFASHRDPWNKFLDPLLRNEGIIVSIKQIKIQNELL